MILQVESVTWVVGTRRILDGASFDVRDGEFVGLLGANGSGKSSMLRCIHGALAPTAGVIRIDGQPIATFSGRALAQRIAVMTQESNANQDFTVEEVVELGRTPHKALFDRMTADDSAIIETALANAGVADFRRQSLGRLSGGERQRVMLARVLAQQPELLLLDEPTNHLDIRYQIELLERVRGLKRTTVAVLHDLNLAAAYCDRLVMLRDGAVLAIGAPGAVLTSETIQRAYGLSCQVEQSAGGLTVRYWPQQEAS